MSPKTNPWSKGDDRMPRTDSTHGLVLTMAVLLFIPRVPVGVLSEEPIRDALI